MMPYSYSIRCIHTDQFYGINHTPKNELHGSTRVAYFSKKKDAEKFASFLTKYMKTHKKVPKLYEYEECEYPNDYTDDFVIYKLGSKYMHFMLGMYGLGFHKCEIVDDFILCLDSGIENVSEIYKINLLKKYLK